MMLAHLHKLIQAAENLLLVIQSKHMGSFVHCQLGFFCRLHMWWNIGVASWFSGIHKRTELQLEGIKFPVCSAVFGRILVILINDTGPLLVPKGQDGLDGIHKSGTVIERVAL